MLHAPLSCLDKCPPTGRFEYKCTKSSKIPHRCI